MTKAAAAFQGCRLDARYTLLEKLGAGGQGEVWRASDGTRGIDIALKLLDPTVVRHDDLWAALEHEFTLASRLNHPAILKVFAPERSGELIVLPMELAAGGDLRRMRGAGYLEIVPVLLDVAQGLEHAHSRGVVHRDLKPGNVLFDARGRPKLADFGVAGTVASAIGAAPQGLSPFTASPEQLRGEPPAPCDDIYGLGALAYELLSGYPPYYPRFDARRAQSEPVPELESTRQIPPALGALVMRMLSKDPGERPQSMGEVIDELEAALNDTLIFNPVPDRQVSPTRRSGEPRESNTAPRSALASLSVPAARPASVSQAASYTPDLARVLAPTALATNPTMPGSVGSAIRSVPAEPPPAAANPAMPASGQCDADSAQLSVADAGLGRPLVAPVDSMVADASEPEPGRFSISGQRSPWDGLSLQTQPSSSLLEPMLTRRAWPFVLLSVLAGAILGGLYLLPRYAPERYSALLSQVSEQVTEATQGATRQGAAALSATARKLGPETPLPSSTPQPTGAKPASAQPSQASSATSELGSETPLPSSTPQTAGAEPGSVQLSQASSAQQPAATRRSDESRLQDSRANFDRRLAELEEHGVATWGGGGYARAKDWAAQSVGAHDAGNSHLAQERLDAALKQLDELEKQAPQPGPQAGVPEQAASATPSDVSARPPSAGTATARAISMRDHASDLEDQERWEEAAQAYREALRSDPSQAFAQEGEKRATQRAELAASLQSFLDHPEQLGSESGRQQGRELLQAAIAASPVGPVLRSQISKLERLLPDFDQLVHVSLTSDEATQVAIPSIGQFGAFSKRDIELKPGRYTLIGTRMGYREVRREIMLVPGQGIVTVSVSCSDPI